MNFIFSLLRVVKIFVLFNPRSWNYRVSQSDLKNIYFSRLISSRLSYCVTEIRQNSNRFLEKNNYRLIKCGFVAPSVVCSAKATRERGVEQHDGDDDRDDGEDDEETEKSARVTREKKRRFNRRRRRRN